ncbi:50S ribosomal protein L27 [Porphyridium purpureum]|uniref:50S ribosomal protein L27 n=1 Tax=Porphyridium purpureum TaxID=35688 RepID=A0A5J4YJD5_PORPP|nr:50S ribosomal protein L27 [Porphyridium purpureum]|eukprot:POR5687..scf289_17
MLSPMRETMPRAGSLGAGMWVRWASKKAKGSSKNGRKTAGKRLGFKKSDGEVVYPGQILVRQLGSNVLPSLGTARARNHSLFALEKGHLRIVKYNGPVRKFKGRGRVFCQVEPTLKDRIEQGIADTPAQRWPFTAGSKALEKGMRVRIKAKPLDQVDRFTLMAQAGSLEEALSYRSGRKRRRPMNQFMAPELIRQLEAKIPPMPVQAVNPPAPVS